MSTNNPNKVALVTGGTRGIGFAIAQRLLAEGMKVAICGTRNETVTQAVASLGNEENVFGFVADVSNPGQVKQFVAAVLARFETIDVLVNNAGLGTFRAVADLEQDQWARMLNVNLSGVYYCCREILPIFQHQGG